MDKFLFVLVIIIAYFLGNISPSTIIGRLHGINIKKEGSGNAGTTNTLRVLGKKAALITLIIDIGKGVLAVFIGYWVSVPLAAMCCALAAFIGHVWPLLLKFQGGKGVAVAFGTIVTVDWRLGLIALAITVVTVLISRYMSLGSIVVAIVFPFIAFFMNREFFPFGLAMGIIIVFKHRTNIVRLAKGQESKLFSKKKSE